MELKEALRKVDRKLGEAYAELELLAQHLAELLRASSAREVGYSLGWAEAGKETICFWGEEEAWPGPRVGVWALLEPCRQCLGLMHIRFEAPFGIYLTPEEAERVRAALRAALGCTDPCPEGWGE